MKRKFNFTTKIFLANFIVIMFAALSVLFIFAHYFLQEEERKMNISLNNLSQSVSARLDSLIYNADTLALQIASNPTTIEYFSTYTQDTVVPNIFAEQSFLRKDFTDFLTSYNFKDSLATRISAYNAPHYVHAGYRVSSDTATKVFFNSKEYKLITNYFSNPDNKRLFLPPREDPFSEPSAYLKEDTLFSVIRGIKDLELLENPTLGYIEVQLPYGKLSDLFADLDPSIQGYIVDSEQKLIYPESDTSVYYDELGITPKENLIASTEIKEADFSVILVQNNDYIFQNQKNIILIMFIAFISVLLITSLLQYALIHYFTKPLIDLQTSLSQITFDNLELNLINDTENDTVIQLNTAFSNLLTHLKSTMQENINAQTREIESHFLALQAQINPHFLHNILTIMSGIAVENDVYEIESMCNKLAGMLRFSTSYKQPTCSVKDEFQYAQDYLDLMKYRYENMLITSCNIEEGSGYITIPKRIVQPLLENSFQHGFKKIPYPWTLDIRFYTIDENWHIEIHDNGIGFSEAYIANFYSKARTVDIDTINHSLNELEIGGLSLRNIYYRMKYFYEDDMIFEISNAPEGGALIHLGGKIDDSGFSCRR